MQYPRLGLEHGQVDPKSSVLAICPLYLPPKKVYVVTNQNWAQMINTKEDLKGVM